MNRNNIEIIPALMPDHYNDIVHAAESLSPLVTTLQLDLMDGYFVPSKTWPFGKHAEHFERLIHEDQGLPLWDKLDYELDLMIKHPDVDFEKWTALGPSRIIVHIESLRDPHVFFESVQSIRMITEIGVALGNDTPVSSIEPFLDRVDFVQCMGIARIGYQGEPFDERVLDMIASVKSLAPDIVISVDGSVNIETAKLLVAAGVTRLVAGSAILGSPDYARNIEQLRASFE